MEQLIKFVVYCVLAAAVLVNSNVSSQSESVHARTRVKRIVNGRIAILKEFPYQVRIVWKGMVCGGSIISDSWILTAAHCLKNSGKGRAQEPIVHTGVHESDPLTLHRIEETILHEAYNQARLNDIALIKVADPLVWSEAVQPIQLADDHQFLSGEAVVAGWGQKKGFKGHRVSPELQTANVTLAPDYFCLQDYHTPFTPCLMICAVGFDQGVCNGDSGSPLVQNGKQIGVVAYGSNDSISMNLCPAPYISFYTRVSSYLDWIQKKCKGCLDNQADQASQKIQARSTAEANQPEVLIAQLEDTKHEVIIAGTKTLNMPTEQDLKAFRCSGSIVGDRWILTSLSCYKRATAVFGRRILWIQTRETFESQNGGWTPVSKIHRHNDRSSFGSSFDAFSLVVLEMQGNITSVSAVNPIQIHAGIGDAGFGGVLIASTQSSGTNGSEIGSKVSRAKLELQTMTFPEGNSTDFIFSRLPKVKPQPERFLYGSIESGTAIVTSASGAPVIKDGKLIGVTLHEVKESNPLVVLARVSRYRRWIQKVCGGCLGEVELKGRGFGSEFESELQNELEEIRPESSPTPRWAINVFGVLLILGSCILVIFGVCIFCVVRRCRRTSAAGSRPAAFETRFGYGL